MLLIKIWYDGYCLRKQKILSSSNKTNFSMGVKESEEKIDASCCFYFGCWITRGMRFE